MNLEYDQFFTNAIELAFRALIEGSYLYQKVAVNFDEAEEQLLAVLRVRDPNSLVKTPERAHAADAKKLRAEFEKRPWKLMTRHLGDDGMTVEINRIARTGTHPMGTPADQIPVRFHLPAVQIYCPGPCKTLTAFGALLSSDASGFGGPFPRNTGKGVEQNFVPVYRCEICRTMIYTLLVRRIGARLHLCGFAPRRETVLARVVPQHIRNILSDAEQAIAENDLFAAFYHLRTMLEHYLKERLRIVLSDQIRGDELIEKHYDALKLEWRSVLPPISPAYATLSQNLHARQGAAEDFAKLRDAICDHLDMLTLLEKQAVR